jgi:hypothetical protein
MNVLPTEYNGIKFRSRTEARWAVFMDAMGIKYVYEHEGYNLDGFLYLPDFWLPEHDFFVEIKGVPPTADESAKASALADFTKKTVFIFCGTPRQPMPLTESFYSESAYAYFPSDGADNGWWWCECPTCGKTDVQFNGRAGRMACHGIGDKDYNHETPKLNSAYELAEKYEFWSPRGGGR